MPITFRRRLRFGPVASALTIILVIAPLMAALLWYVRADGRDRLRAEIDADYATIAIAELVMPAVQAMAMLEKQSTGDLLYIVLDPATGKRIAGSPIAWPRTRPDARGWIVTARGDPAGPMIARVGWLDRTYPVLIGRRTTGLDRTRDRMLIALGLIALVVFGSILFAARLELLRTRRRLERFDAKLVAFAAGDTSARIDDKGGDIVEQAARRIDESLDRLANFIRGKVTIAEQIAHELRDPVALAASRLDLADNPADAVAEARHAIGRLGAMVDGILAVSGVSNRELRIEPIDLAPIATAIADLYADTVETRGLGLHTDLRHAPTRGEAALISQVIANLLSNAIKFTAEGTQIALETRTEGAEAIVRVTDAGVGTRGLPKGVGNYLARGSSALGVEGLGLGLATVTRIVERHRGVTRFFDRVDGIGLVAEVRLPVSRDGEV